MKKNILVSTLTVLLTAMNIFAQEDWTEQLSDTDKTLYSVDFINSLHGIAVGESGTILKTIDGGFTWQNINTCFPNNLNGISFYDATHAVAVGDGGQIIVTEDGGNTWTTHWLPGIQFNLYAVDVSPDGKGIATGQHGTILYTSDGGYSWSVVQEDQTGSGWSVLRFNENVTYVFGTGTASNRIYQLFDNQVANVYDFMVNYQGGNLEGLIYDGYLFNNETIVTVGHIVFYPNYYGTITSRQDMYAPVWESCFTMEACQFRGVDFIGNHGIAVGGSAGYEPDRGIIVETNDEGFTWNVTFESDKTPNLKDVKMIGNAAYAVGDYGIILKKSISTPAFSHELNENGLTISPNPSGEINEISFTLPSSEKVDIAIYDLNGRFLQTIFLGELNAGSHRIANPLTARTGKRLQPGVYIMRLLAGNTVNTAKMIIQ